jgi:aspartyl-tRNA(Asn)/glutamyl-tRNA(Gln) amidotransferase subunit A
MHAMSAFLPQRARLERCLERIAQSEWQLQAFAYLRPADELRAEAGLADERAAAGRQRSPLDGMPLAVDDLIDTAGIFTECGSRELAGRLPERDADVVSRLLEAGTILLGKLRVDERGVGVRTPPARNAVDAERSPGGASGGAGAAVAAGMVEGALGGAAGGSILVPAAYNGAVGLRPTPGIVPLGGVWPVGAGLVCGAIGPDVATVEALLRVVGDAGALATPPSPPPPASGGPALRVGLSRRPFCDDLQEAVEQAFDYALGVLRGIGWELIELDLEPSTEAAAALAALGGVDLIATPTVPLTAPPHDAYALVTEGGEELPLERAALRNCLLWAEAGAPAVSLPCAADGDGLPIGLQLIAAPRADLALLAAAAAVEQALAAALE